jgi:urease accessory protein
LLIQHDKVIEELIIKLGGKITKIKDEFNPEGGAYGLGRTHGHKH